MSEKPVISGWERKTSLGTTVWGGIHGDSVLWKFTDADGNATYLCLSHEAMRAMIGLSDRIMPEIADPAYKILIELVGKAAEKLESTDSEVWKVAPEDSPDSASPVTTEKP